MTDRQKSGVWNGITGAAFIALGGFQFFSATTPEWLPVVFGAVGMLAQYLKGKFVNPSA